MMRQATSPNAKNRKTEKQYKLHMRSIVYETVIVRATSKREARKIFDPVGLVASALNI
jgi:hypothetical protein